MLFDMMSLFPAVNAFASEFSVFKVLGTAAFTGFCDIEREYSHVCETVGSVTDKYKQPVVAGLGRSLEGQVLVRLALTES